MNLNFFKTTPRHSNSDFELPENVTEEPRNDEEMHLKLLRDSENAIKAYLPVSDDQGELLGNIDLESRVKQFCDQHANSKVPKKEDLEKVLQEAKELATSYNRQINIKESIVGGIIAKYRMRQGMLFNIMKGLVRESEANWVEWFKKNFDGREFRSVQDYMRLAKVSGIIRYAVLGKERLMQILRQLTDDDKKQKDFVGAFLERNGVDFNPEEELDAQELRVETDVAINYQKLLNEDITEIPKELLDALVRNGKDLEPKHIVDIKAAKAAGKDLKKYMKELIAGNGKIDPIMTPDRKAEGFKKNAARFIKAIENALDDGEYLGQFDQELYNRLKEKVLELEQRFSIN